MAIRPSAGGSAEEQFFRPDAADTRHRLRHAGPHASEAARESSTLVRLADALLGSGRARLASNLARAKSQIEDFAADELDKWWGRILGIDRIAGIDEAAHSGGQGVLQDELYATRLRMLMQAANKGVSPESMRLAAEAGSGVPFRVEEAAGTVVLTPLSEITVGQRASVYEAARRMAPASLRFVVDELSESHTPLPATEFYSPSFYVGAPPERIGVAGPVSESESYLRGAESSNWARSGARSLRQTDGLPSNLVGGMGSWHTSALGSGGRADLSFHLGGERMMNRVALAVSSGIWEITLMDENGSALYRERARIGGASGGFEDVKIDLPLAWRRGGSISFVNASREPTELFVEDLYAGLRLTPENRVEYLALGGLASSGSEGMESDGIVGMPAEPLAEAGREWLSSAEASPNAEVEFRVSLSGSPVPVSALSIGTDLPGVLFRVEYSTENASLREAENWTPLPGAYRLTNGRVAIEPCVARHLRLVFTNLSPLRLASYTEYEPRTGGS